MPNPGQPTIRLGASGNAVRRLQLARSFYVDNRETGGRVAFQAAIAESKAGHPSPCAPSEHRRFTGAAPSGPRDHLTQLWSVPAL